MKRQSSATSLRSLLDMSRDQDLDSCCSDSDVFDPPAWRPGRYLQFADILTVEEEPSVRPVSLSTERLGPHGLCTGAGGGVVADGFGSASGGDVLLDSRGAVAVQMESDMLTSVRHTWRSPLSRRTTLVVTACMAVALTALTLLSFVLC
ncbi:uncharacterized protein LOC143286191 [Babylonia areolata]|uniref:uncharacterized protein LOC143286191 n=1 Tax=Babylonia areolata TaxID=304850 RepID=UPI003FD3436C